MIKKMCQLRKHLLSKKIKNRTKTIAEDYYIIQTCISVNLSLELTNYVRLLLRCETLPEIAKEYTSGQIPFDHLKGLMSG